MIRLASISDVHVPFHDDNAVTKALAVIKKWQPDILYLNGDIIDFYSISAYDKDPARLLLLQEEIDKTIELFGKIRHAVGEGCSIVYLEGNHEARLQKYLARHPEISQLNCLKLEELLKLSDFDIHLHPNLMAVIGDTIVTHGTIVRSKSGYTGHGQLEKWGMSGISGHTHRLSAVHRTTFGSDYVWLEQGCLCDLHPSYVDGTPDWQQGFAIGTSDEGKTNWRLISIKSLTKEEME